MDFDDVDPDLWEGAVDEDPDWNSDVMPGFGPDELQPVAEEKDDSETVFLPDDFKITTNISVEIPSSTLVAPRSHYQGEDEDGQCAPPERERTAVQHLLEHQRLNGLDSEHDFIEFDLDQFVVYIQPKMPGTSEDYDKIWYPNELRPLHHLSHKLGCSTMFVDGVLSVGNMRYFVRQIPFDELPIGNYGEAEPTIDSAIWVRSRMNANAAKKRPGVTPDVYYRLKSPAIEYRRFHTVFVWVADLAKHVVDYLSAAIDEARGVSLQNFRCEFNSWLLNKHQGSEAFGDWKRQYPSQDFRVAIVANLKFIYKEAYGVLGHHKVRSIRLWKEIREFTAFADTAPTISSAPVSAANSPAPETLGKSGPIPKTVVTPYIYDLFKDLPCGMMMEAVSPSIHTDKLRGVINTTHRFESSSNIHTSVRQVNIKPWKDIFVGDVISTPRDENDTHWAMEEGDDCWLGLVQKIHMLKNGTRSFDVIWFYKPADTLCGRMKYPWNNEIFLSDHCSCGSNAKIQEEEVLSVHSVDWGGSAETNAEFFCRQTYLHDLDEGRRWVTFQKSHLRCCHHQEGDANTFLYAIGDTVLVRLARSDSIVEPCELMSLPENSDTVTVRLLYRRQQLQPHANAPPNELVYSDDTKLVSVEAIHGRCLVRFVHSEEPIAAPYNRNGVGNAFFITHRLLSGEIFPMDDGFTSLKQGFDPMKPAPKLRGVDLFCGGGNFGRGLEEGGAIEMKWAVDINSKAMHTYMANTTTAVSPFTGSIDDMQRLALEGKWRDNVPEVGKVDFVSGGSPCPGFSLLTVNKDTPKQRKNQSLVAAFASFIDTYRPKFGLLENVMEIVQSKGQRTEDVFCQLICALVGLGYQTHFFLLDAWNYGAPQSRSRVFLCFAAPGLRLPAMPMHSHSHYDATPRTKTLGYLPNGEAMVERRVMWTPFKFVSAEEATQDLPDIADAKPDICIPFPDHRVACGITKKLRVQCGIIPMHPHGMNFWKSWKDGKGIMTMSERSCFPQPTTNKSKQRHGVIKTSKAWGRIPPRKVMQTITTSLSPADARMASLHWNQNRTLTVMEARRAQGFLDNEVILGQPNDQWKVVGNSVARGVSIALGLSIREAWLGSLVDGDEIDPSTRTTQSPDVCALDTLPLATSLQTSRASSSSSRPSSSRASPATTSKNRLTSTLEVNLFASKISKTRATKGTSHRRTDLSASKIAPVVLESTESPASEMDGIFRIESDIPSGRKRGTPSMTPRWGA